MDRALSYWRALPGQARMTLVVFGLACSLLLYMLLSPLVSIWAENRATIDALEPRIGRMLGFEESEDTLKRSLERSSAQLEEYTYDSEQDLSGLGALLQQLVRELAEETGLKVSGSQLVGAEGGEGIDGVAVNVELRGPVDALELFIQELSVARPLLSLVSLRINVPRQRRGVEPTDQLISFSVRVAAFRLSPA